MMKFNCHVLLTSVVLVYLFFLYQSGLGIKGPMHLSCQLVMVCVEVQIGRIWLWYEQVYLGWVSLYLALWILSLILRVYEQLSSIAYSSLKF